MRVDAHDSHCLLLTAYKTVCSQMRACVCAPVKSTLFLKKSGIAAERGNCPVYTYF